MLNTRSDRTPATRMARLISVTLLSVAALAVASAQGVFSTLSGSVVDPQNGVLPDVKLVLTNKDSGAKYEIRTDRSGHFEFVGLPSGRYSLDAALPGFATLQGDVELTGQNVQRDLALKIGSLRESITVRANSSPERAGSSIGATNIHAQTVRGRTAGGGRDWREHPPADEARRRQADIPSKSCGNAHGGPRRPRGADRHRRPGPRHPNDFRDASGFRERCQGRRAPVGVQRNAPELHGRGRDDAGDDDV